MPDQQTGAPGASKPKPTAEEKRLRKRERELVKGLRGLVAAVEAHLKALDAEMAGPSTVERGKRVARLCNALEMSKDQARFGPLNIDFRTGKPRKNP